MSDIDSKNPKRFRGICVITGASKGFGRALAFEVSHLLKPGSVLLLAARSETLLRELKEELQSSTGEQQLRVHCIAVDLSTTEGVNETVRVARQEAENAMDRVLLINSAGSLGNLSQFASFTDPHAVNSYLSFNVSSALALTAGILQVFPCKPGLQWSVVNVSSIFAKRALPSWVLYCTAKAAREMMFRVLAVEQPNVKVLSYSPGAMDTDMQREIRRLTGASHHLLPCKEPAAKLMKVTLKFGFQVELCRVDVELWPWGMDRGQASKRLEISTSSDRLPSQHSGPGQKRVQQRERMELKDQNELDRETQQGHDSKARLTKGHQWSLQAQQWGEQAQEEPQQRHGAFRCQSNIESSHPEPDFKLVGRCELREETHVCFARSNISPRPPFLSPPPPQPANCRREELWSRGLLSLGAVTQLRVTVPFGGAASALGLKALVVWGQPARCCPAEEVERIKRVHEASERRLPRPVFFAPSVSQTRPPERGASPPSDLSIPEEFLDPITQEVMMLPMLLPSGVSVDNTTLEEHQKREATWGRPPNDPFTGVLFTSTSQPLPNPQLKSRIDHFLLQKGMMRRDGMLGRQGEGENPQASRLIASKVDGQSQNSPCLGGSSMNKTAAPYYAGTRNTNRTIQKEDSGLGHSPDKDNHTSNSLPLGTDSKRELERRKKRDLSGMSKESTEGLTAENQLLPQTKRPRDDAGSVPSCSSHEQRLSASLDEALTSALQGRPSFTSNLSQQRRVTSDSEPLSPSQQCQTAGTQSTSTGEKTCSACSCSVSVYSKSASSIYRLSCGHLLCRPCMRRESQSLNSDTMATSNHILCPECQSPAPRSDIMRVHH